MMVSRARMVSLHCLVQIGILLTLMWKWSYFVWSDGIHRALTISDPFFPDWLESAGVVRYAYLFCLAAIVINIVSWNQRLCPVLLLRDAGMFVRPAGTSSQLQRRNLYDCMVGVPVVDLVRASHGRS